MDRGDVEFVGVRSLTGACANAESTKSSHQIPIARTGRRFITYSTAKSAYLDRIPDAMTTKNDESAPTVRKLCGHLHQMLTCSHRHRRRSWRHDQLKVRRNGASRRDFA